MNRLILESETGVPELHSLHPETKVHFDVNAIRAQFPILSRQVNGKPLIYLDSAASAQKPTQVTDAMAAAANGSYSNVHRGLHTLANETTDAFEAARRAVAGFLNAGSPDEIVFTSGATEAINLVANSYGQRLGPGDEIVLSELEHHANLVPWFMLRERRGVTLRFVPVTDDGALDMDAFHALLGPKTQLVALTHMSNVTGAISDARAIAAAAHAAGAVVLFDGSQAVVHRPVDVRAISADFYVFSAHKLYGPTGIGALYGRAELLADMPPWQGGGGDDRLGVASGRHLRRAAAPVRGGHAADSGSDRAEGGHRLVVRARSYRHRGARTGALRPRGRTLVGPKLAPHHRNLAGQGGDPEFSRWRALTRTMWRRSWIAMGSRCGPARIAPNL